MPGLYIHVPFCQKKCHYCNFVITTGSPAAQGDLFLRSLEREMTWHASAFSKRPFDTLYVGGGTPSQLSQAQTEALFRLARKYFKFKKTAEVSWEANPGDIDAQKAQLYKKLGVNRVSLGAQSFNDSILKTANRSHRAADIYQSFDRLRSAGIANINMDIILALPEQTHADIESTLRHVRQLKPPHISLYELVIEEKTVFAGRLKKGRLPLPAEDKALSFLKKTREGLKRQGYSHYELLNYSKPGFESRHNKLYWKNEEYLGLGPGAFSYYEGRRYQYASTVEGYYKKINALDRSNEEEESLPPDKKLIESLLLRLRLLKEGADLREFKELPPAYEPLLVDLQKKGLLSKKGSIVRLSAQGQLFAESVFSQLASP